MRRYTVELWLVESDDADDADRMPDATFTVRARDSVRAERAAAHLAARAARLPSVTVADVDVYVDRPMPLRKREAHR